jgi:hypothetical protein
MQGGESRLAKTALQGLSGIDAAGPQRVPLVSGNTLPGIAGPIPIHKR